MQARGIRVGPRRKYESCLSKRKLGGAPGLRNPGGFPQYRVGCGGVKDAAQAMTDVPAECHIRSIPGLPSRYRPCFKGIGGNDISHDQLRRLAYAYSHGVATPTAKNISNNDSAGGDG